MQEIEFEDLDMEGFEEVKPETFENTEGEPVKNEDPAQNAGSIISPEFAAEIIDTVFPGLIQVGFNLMGRKIKMIELKATRFEKENMIIPTIAEYLKTIDVSNISPLEKFMVCMASVYGIKAVVAFPQSEKVQRNEAGEVKVERRGRPRKNG